jgi:hypothetical protein
MERMISPDRVQQEDDNGCWVACMAMITGKTYAQVKSETGHLYERGGHIWATDQYLGQNGFAVARFWKHNQLKGHGTGTAWINDKAKPWPLLPFAPIHICLVHTPTGGHLIVMLNDGTVLDPAKHGRGRLADYTTVEKIAGIWKVRPNL